MAVPATPPERLCSASPSARLRNPVKDCSIISSTWRSIRSASASDELFGVSVFNGGKLCVALESQLKDPLVLHVLQVLLPEVDDRHALRQVVPEQRARRLREQDLAAVARRADARRADDVEAEVALVADGRLAGVQAHPHPHLGPLRPGVRTESPLSRNRAGDRLPLPAGRSRRTHRPACRLPRRPLRPGARGGAGGARGRLRRSRHRAPGAAASSPRCR